METGIVDPASSGARAVDALGALPLGGLRDSPTEVGTASERAFDDVGSANEDGFEKKNPTAQAAHSAAAQTAQGRAQPSERNAASPMSPPR